VGHQEREMMIEKYAHGQTVSGPVIDAVGRRPVFFAQVGALVEKSVGDGRMRATTVRGEC